MPLNILSVDNSSGTAGIEAVAILISKKVSNHRSYVFVVVY